MKAVADYVHSKGLKFGMYSCAGARTCAGYPGSYDHEFVDAQTFADWGVDYLKYDYCNFPSSGDCKARYLTMSMALKATGREILFSACNWGQQEPGTWMRQIGAHIQKQQMADAVSVLLGGDGNENPATIYTVGSSPISGTKGQIKYDQLVEFWGQFDPYTMNTILCSTATMTDIMKIPELQNPMAGLNFQGTGKVGTPLGANLLRSSAVADGTIIGLDNRYALELVRAGDVLVEYDKLIDRQLERAAITSISGFGKICTDAAKVLNV
jgi:hypothetical protein